MKIKRLAHTYPQMAAIRRMPCEILINDFYEIEPRPFGGHIGYYAAKLQNFAKFLTIFSILQSIHLSRNCRLSR